MNDVMEGPAMKTALSISSLAACASLFFLFSTGCVIHSLHPWLSEDSRVENPSLTGKWLDAKKKTHLEFTIGGDGYSMLGASINSPGADLGDALMANDVMVYARKLGTVDYQTEGRIVIE